MNLNVNEVNQDSVTWAENTFKRALLNKLFCRGIECEVGHNQIIPVPIDYFPKSQRLDNSRAKYGYQIIRPDFIIPKLCLVIEIDGLIHERSEKKMLKDHHREIILNKLGFDVLRVPNEAIHNFKRGKTRELEYYLSIILEIAKSAVQPSFKAKRNRAKNKITRVRRRFRFFEKSLKNRVQLHSYPELKHIKSATKYGGYVYWVSKKF